MLIHSLTKPHPRSPYDARETVAKHLIFVRLVRICSNLEVRLRCTGCMRSGTLGDCHESKNYCGTTLVSVSGKVLTLLMLMWIHNQLLKLQRFQCLKFTPGNSTTDRIPRLYVMVEHRRELQQWMLPVNSIFSKRRLIHLIARYSGTSYYSLGLPQQQLI